MLEFETSGQKSIVEVAWFASETSVRYHTREESGVYPSEVHRSSRVYGSSWTPYVYPPIDGVWSWSPVWQQGVYEDDETVHSANVDSAVVCAMVQMVAREVVSRRLAYSQQAWYGAWVLKL